MREDLDLNLLPSPFTIAMLGVFTVCSTLCLLCKLIWSSFLASYFKYSLCVFSKRMSMMQCSSAAPCEVFVFLIFYLLFVGLRVDDRFVVLTFGLRIE
jgi:hypothetical protein